MTILIKKLKRSAHTTARTCKPARRAEKETEDKMTQTPPEIKIGILQTGQNRAELKNRFEEYPVMFDRLLNGQAGARWTILETYQVLEGIFPPSLTSCDGYIVTGSAAGVYEDHSWMDPLMDFICNAHDAKSRFWASVLGIRRLHRRSVVRW